MTNRLMAIGSIDGPTFRVTTLEAHDARWLIKSLIPMILILVLIPIFDASAASWSGSVKTDSDSWSITRESNNLSFIYDQSVQGQISPVDYRGRTLSPYHSYYKDVNVNDVRLKERTAALQGSYSSEEQLLLKSNTNNSVNMTIVKPAGSDVYTIDFYEKWPVKLIYTKSMNYSGKEINNREFVGNNKDYVGANFLYNKEFSEERSLKMNLLRMNATILATDEAIDLSEVKATRDTQYKLQSHSTGIANFEWRQVGTEDEILNAGDERYVGVFDIYKNIRMKSRFDTILKEDEWLPCCSGGFFSMNPVDQIALKSAKGVFDCTCYTQPEKAVL